MARVAVQQRGREHRNLSASRARAERPRHQIEPVVARSAGRLDPFVGFSSLRSTASFQVSSSTNERSSCSRTPKCEGAPRQPFS